MAHSKLSNVCFEPSTRTSNVLSYSLPHTSQVAAEAPRRAVSPRPERRPRVAGAPSSSTASRTPTCPFLFCRPAICVSSKELVARDLLVSTRRLAALDERLESHEIVVELLLRIRLEQRGESMTDRAQRRVVGQAHVDPRAALDRGEEHGAGALDGRVRDRTPREQPPRLRTRHLGLPSDVDPARPFDAPVPASIARDAHLADVLHEPGEVLRRCEEPVELIGRSRYEDALLHVDHAAPPAHADQPREWKIRSRA